MTTYMMKYVGESCKLTATLEQLDGFIWNNSLENDYKIIIRKDQRLWLCEANEKAITIISEAFEEMEFTTFFGKD